jgi:hypothetical protein
LCKRNLKVLILQGFLQQFVQKNLSVEFLFNFANLGFSGKCQKIKFEFMSDDKEIKATLPQLRGAFKRHGKIAEMGDSSSDSCHLLRFYANECGLKALFIKENQLNDTSDFILKPGVKYGYGHDLIKWMDAIKIPNFVVPFSDNPNDPVKKSHEKLRYGVKTQIDHTVFLNSLYKLIKKHL